MGRLIDGRPLYFTKTCCTYFETIFFYFSLYGVPHTRNPAVTVLHVRVLRVSKRLTKRGLRFVTDVRFQPN